jgi:hypothetical protein
MADFLHTHDTLKFINNNLVDGVIVAVRVRYPQPHQIAYSFGLIWLAENTVAYFFLREKHCWLTDLADNLERTG